MKLERMTLTNFRQFYGEQSISFSTHKERNVTVINGAMGAGKTSLHRALIWCLYGYWDESSRGEIINKRALSEVPINFKIETKVQLMFTHASERYAATRSLQAIRVSEKGWEPAGEPSFSLTKIGFGGQYETVRNAENHIEFILPYNVSQYFFFDAEQIDEFAKPGHEDMVQSAVRNVLKIEVLERARTHLAAVARDYQKDLKKLASGKLQLLLASHEGLQNEFEKEQRTLDELRAERLAAKRQLDEIGDRLGQIEDSRGWEEKRKQVNVKLEASEQQRKHLWAEIKDLTNLSFVELASPVLVTATRLLDEKREHGEIPPGIREQFINDLIERGECICRRPITEGSEEHHHLTQLLQKSVSTSLTNTVIQCAGYLRTLLATSGDNLGQIRAKMKEKADMDDEIDSLNQELDEISSHLQGFDYEEVRSLEKKRKEYQERIYSLLGEIGGKEQRIELLRKAIDDSKSSIDKAEVSERKARKLQRCLSLTNRTYDAVDKMFGEFAYDMRQKIQKEAKENFQKLVWKESQFQDVSVNEDYHLEVFDRWGLPARRELSAGERQVLSLAFITGMSKVAGEEAPLVMDTPFGRLSSEPRESITKHIPEIPEQLILFVTDEELHSQARKNLEPRIAAEYELQFDQDTGSTIIRQLK